MKNLNNEVFIFDNKLTQYHLTELYFYCLKSRYTLEQTNEKFYPGRDLTFSCHLTQDEFLSLKLTDIISNLIGELRIPLYLTKFYINHYSQFSYVHRHVDSSHENNITILFFCNKYWEESWGGELKIYEQSGPFHKVIDFVPGRIIIFDSRIEHKVLPLTPDAKMDRFSLAIKGVTDKRLCSSEELESSIYIPLF